MEILFYRELSETYSYPSVYGRPFPGGPYGGLRYNNISLALPITFMALPSFGRKPPVGSAEVPTGGARKYQILSLGIALTHAQEYCPEQIDGITYRGLEFLSRLASAHGSEQHSFP